jgi:hypothetical protein
MGGKKDFKHNIKKTDTSNKTQNLQLSKLQKWLIQNFIENKRLFKKMVNYKYEHKLSELFSFHT